LGRGRFNPPSMTKAMGNLLRSLLFLPHKPICVNLDFFPISFLGYIVI
jgi:hypothetical protein